MQVFTAVSTNKLVTLVINKMLKTRPGKFSIDKPFGSLKKTC
jgi:hypothetical protein